MRLVGGLVLGEPDVPIDAVHRRLRIDDELRGERPHIHGERRDDVGHRLADVLLVIVAVRVEPVAAIVALQGPKESKRLVREPRRGHRLTDYLAAPAVWDCALAIRSRRWRVRCGTRPSIRWASISCPR